MNFKSGWHWSQMYVLKVSVLIKVHLPLTLPCTGSKMSGYLCIYGGGRVFQGHFVDLQVYKSKLFLAQKCQKIFLCLKVVKNTEKIEKNFEKKIWISFFIKSIFIIIHELCQHLGSLRSLWKYKIGLRLAVLLYMQHVYSSVVQSDFVRHAEDSLQEFLVF